MPSLMHTWTIVARRSQAHLWLFTDSESHKIISEFLLAGKTLSSVVLLCLPLEHSANQFGKFST